MLAKMTAKLHIARYAVNKSAMIPPGRNTARDCLRHDARGDRHRYDERRPRTLQLFRKKAQLDWHDGDRGA